MENDLGDSFDVHCHIRLWESHAGYQSERNPTYLCVAVDHFPRLSELGFSVDLQRSTGSNSMKCVCGLDRGRWSVRCLSTFDMLHGVLRAGAGIAAYARVRDLAARRSLRALRHLLPQWEPVREPRPVQNVVPPPLSYSRTIGKFGVFPGVAIVRFDQIPHELIESRTGVVNELADMDSPHRRWNKVTIPGEHQPVLTSVDLMFNGEVEIGINECVGISTDALVCWSALTNLRT